MFMDLRLITCLPGEENRPVWSGFTMVDPGTGNPSPWHEPLARGIGSQGKLSPGRKK